MAIKKIFSCTRYLPGYTLIELLAAVAITALLSVAAVQILFQGQLRSSQAEQTAIIRREGIFVIEQISHHLRNAVGAQCLDPQRLQVETRDGQVIDYFLDTDEQLSEAWVASNSARLTSPKVEVTGLIFDCQAATEDAGTLVKVNLSLVGSESVQPDDANQRFETSVYVRSRE